jgi:hypothetical protein
MSLDMTCSDPGDLRRSLPAPGLRPAIRYVVRPDPERATVEVRAIMSLDGRRPLLRDFGQLASIRWSVGGIKVQAEPERSRDTVVFAGLPRSGEAQADYALKVVTKPEPGYRKRLMGGDDFLLVREGLLLGKERGQDLPVEIEWDLPPGWTLMLGRPGIQPFGRTQKRLWVAGRAQASFGETVEGRTLRGRMLAGVTKIDGATLRRTLTTVFRSGLERFGPARLGTSRATEDMAAGQSPGLPSETYGVVVFPCGAIGGGTALGFDLASEEDLPTIVHEMLHWWTNASAPAWFREGVHSYIAVRMMADLGLLTAEGFLEAVRGFHAEHLRVREREGAAATLAASANAYDQGQGGGDMYGAMPLLAYKLDREVRAADPRADLVQVFAEVCRRRPAPVDVLALIKLRTGYDPGPLFEKYFLSLIVDAAELLR